MRRALLKYVPQLHHYHHHSTLKPIPNILASSTLRFFSSDTENSTNLPESITTSSSKPLNIQVEDVNNKELKARIDKYFKENDEEAIPLIFQGVLARQATKKHEETDDELMDEMSFRPIDDVKDKDFESDFEELYDTDEDIDNLYDAQDIVRRRMVHDEYFNMDEKKWDEMIQEGVSHGHLQDMTECEQILEDMLSWDKLLPDEIKEKVKAKFDELGDMCERGELTPEEAFELYEEYEDKMVEECKEIMKAEKPPVPDKETNLTVPEKNNHLDDPPGEGPILRWQTRVIFGPGGDAWHPKNRKVKLSVTVSEFELSKHALRRLREVVGKRYHPGKDELTITSERYEHREENRKDCLRTLYAVIADAMKADKLVEESRASYVKKRLRGNPEFMRRLQAKTTKMKGSHSALPA